MHDKFIQKHIRSCTFVCIYGPNKDSPQFYEYTRKNMTETENNCVLVGDLVLSPEKVYFNYMHLNNPKCY